MEAEDCPFCAIAAASPAPPRPTTSSPLPSNPPNKSVPMAPPVSPAHIILTHPLLLVFLDLQPLTHGHVLLCPRAHRGQVGDLSPEEAEAVGWAVRVLGKAIGRWVSGGGRPVLPGTQERREADGNSGSGSWNLVVNNGPLAAQTIPHVHFHFIPRWPLDSTPPHLLPAGPNAASQTPSEREAESRRKTWIMFGRGQRGDLDDEEAAFVGDALRTEVDAVLREDRERAKITMGKL
ncbi:MAG: hypothetical protein M4579_001033 [Chaenotheca gracillima]|nr:MAG: hypothetical protein M4579_001033 [Chaenotheca gracillima]